MLELIKNKKGSGENNATKKSVAKNDRKNMRKGPKNFNK